LGERRFTVDTIVSIRDHYTDEANDFALAHLLNLAAGAADRRGHGLPGETGYWSLTPARLAAAGLNRKQFDAAEQLALEKFQALRAAVS
jgi:hypothetical protein